jgi:Sigma 54 modulation/S30EA ribosomal protein C terminus
VERLMARLRKAADRRRVHHGTRTPISVRRATVAGGAGSSTDGSARAIEQAPEPAGDAGHQGPMVVREKTHQASPMNLDQALYEMELVGHDFYLFVDADTKTPSVVYRRHGYDYGVIHLDV